MSRSVFRFLGSGQRSRYGVRRGDEPLGFVTKIVHRHTDRGVTRTIIKGWTPSTPDGRDLAIAETREAAAKALWSLHQQERYAHAPGATTEKKTAAQLDDEIAEALAKNS